VDPDVDEARNYLAQDMLRSQGIERFGWVKGVGAASPAEPHHMDEGSPFFTDGLRVVLWFASRLSPSTKSAFFPGTSRRRVKYVVFRERPRYRE